ncbi:hypothetical protein BXZ70DRAFT_1063855 [Cristinia sonorae]|uniref:Uncharacterized protein n=1 Tax=Cristinia sonorae TaxID=1940300 RepID=A0A8K0URN4_9AGAR|nr:hypothetical protein BXZ70DRAFT_1063855 [Cristinia sonorae]
MNDPSSQWHSIRPWRPTLSLSVREITSVSATFILSSPLAFSRDSPSDDADDDENEDEEEYNGSDEDLFESDVVLEGEEGRRRTRRTGRAEQSNQAQQQRRTQIVADALSKGLSVKVNGTPWQRVLMKVDDEADEAVIILFGLMPGRQYDVELGIVPAEISLRSLITTELSVSQGGAENGQRAIEFSSNGDQQQQHLVPSISPNVTSSLPTSNGSPQTASTASAAPLTATPSFSLEDRRLQLTHTLNQLNNEHTTLTATLKTARREAQKADAALRSEIEVLKRASEKNAGQEHRARQKVLALQEAVRRTVAATEEVKAMIEEVEGLLPGLEVRRLDVEREWQRVRGEAKDVQDQREEVEREERRRLETMQSEIVGLGNRTEKLNVKRERLEGEGGVLSELEERLRRLEEERLRVESDPYGYEEEVIAEESEGEVLIGRRRGSVDSRTGDSPPSDHQQYPQLHPLPGHPHHTSHHHPHHTHQHHQTQHTRKRHSHPANSRNAAAAPPIQRPSHNSRLSLPAGPGVIHLNKAAATTTTSQTKAQSSSAVAGSTLSSRAPPFEPGRRAPLLPANNNSGASVKSDLNPGSSPFSPRSSAALAATGMKKGAVAK